MDTPNIRKLFASITARISQPSYGQLDFWSILNEEMEKIPELTPNERSFASETIREVVDGGSSWPVFPKSTNI